jgi:hypothetical protein
MMNNQKPFGYTIFHVILLSIILFIGANNMPIVSAEALENLQSDLPSQTPAGGLSTPDLIEQAFSRSEITAEERILYLAYALFDYSSLPNQFHSNIGWYGSSYLEEVSATINKIKADKNPSLSPMFNAELTTLATQFGTVCNMEDGSNTTESDNFHLSYDTVGGGLTIEDYKVSLETTFSTEVNNYGWAKPPLCTSGIGSCIDTNPWNKYPVQLVNLHEGLYGYVGPSSLEENYGNYTGVVGDNPNTSATETIAQATCMVLNSDFSQIIGHTAQENLDATTAHEFNQAIQRGYGSALQDKMWREATSAYIEDDVFDAVNDNYQYLWPEFTACQGDDFDSTPFFQPDLKPQAIRHDLAFPKGRLSDHGLHLIDTVSAFQEHILERPPHEEPIEGTNPHALNLAFDLCGGGIPAQI